MIIRLIKRKSRSYSPKTPLKQFYIYPKILYYPKLTFIYFILQMSSVDSADKNWKQCYINPTPVEELEGDGEINSDADNTL